ncbi:HTH domain-containing protein [Vibrio vulnificus]|nr:HTH domain-containing protein [Vibrio vulnificus]MCU8299906.1 transcriptional regulator [Vibrio vulnificus]HAS8196454.1 HTH domain-containing protein [Vibrio vulnificus]HAS8367073.1 HTH domain-containing protein [Vibrio vulnificus]
MFTSMAYFPSPIDGNYYPTYVQLADGQLAEVHFYNGVNGLELVYYPNAAWGQAPTPISVHVVIQNGNSNLAYYQPQQYGQAQLLYCTSRMHQHLTLMLNTEFQQFVPVNICDSDLLQLQKLPTDIIPHAAYMEQNPNRIPVNVGTNLPPEIIQGLQAVQNGALTNISITSNQQGFHLTAEDHEGNRYVLEKYTKNGISHISETTVDTSTVKMERQLQVKQLRSNKMTQSQIANYLGVSQKTISNDLKELGLK